MTKNKEENWIDVHDDSAVRSAGLYRPLVLDERDESVWTKTPHEKYMLKKAKRFCKNKNIRLNSFPRKVSRVRDKLIVNLFKNKIFDRTTYSIECWQHEIPNILSRYRTISGKNLVRKYVWNGRTYNPSDLPFWG